LVKIISLLFIYQQHFRSQLLKPVMMMMMTAGMKKV